MLSFLFVLKYALQIIIDLPTYQILKRRWKFHGTVPQLITNVREVYNSGEKKLQHSQ
jgi:hypothetical protein